MINKLRWLVLLSVFDAFVTDYVLKMGGEEFNPVFNYFLTIGWSVWQTKLSLLIPIIVTWWQLYTLDKRIAEICLNFSLKIMILLAAFEICGLLYIWF